MFYILFILCVCMRACVWYKGLKKKSVLLLLFIIIHKISYIPNIFNQSCQYAYCSWLLNIMCEYVRFSMYRMSVEECMEKERVHKININHINKIFKTIIIINKRLHSSTMFSSVEKYK